MCVWGGGRGGGLTQGVGSGPTCNQATPLEVAHKQTTAGIPGYDDFKVYTGNLPLKSDTSRLGSQPPSKII